MDDSAVPVSGTILLLNGPNLNLLGNRDSRHYGSCTLADVEQATREVLEASGLSLECRQSNHEGQLIDWIQTMPGRFAGLLINAGAFTHTSYAMRDAIEATRLPAIEIHLSDVQNREPFRRVSTIRDVCAAVFSGHGIDSYRLAAREMSELLAGAAGREGGREDATTKHESDVAADRRSDAVMVPRASASTLAPHPDIGDLRRIIDGEDEAILAAFGRRMEAVRRIATLKAGDDRPVLQPSREEAILNKARVFGGNGAHGDSERAVFLMRQIMQVSRNAQYDLMLRGGARTAWCDRLLAAPTNQPPIRTVVNQGAAGAYSEQAARMLFPDLEPERAETFGQACDRVLAGEADVAVLPIENSTAGAVHLSLDAIQERGLWIGRTLSLPIRHRLLALPGVALDEIRQVASHPQALSQCARAIAAHGWKTVEAINTATAAAEVAVGKDRSVAAIASGYAAQKYGLNVLAADFQDARLNRTRFAAVSREAYVAADADRLSLVLELEHRSGTLAAAMQVFAALDFNLVRIESRPDPRQPWNYTFYLDMQATPSRQSDVLLALTQLERESVRLHVFGWYREIVADD